MLEALCIYGMEMSRSVIVGSMLSTVFFLIAGWTEFDKDRQKWYYITSFIFLLLVIFFPHDEVWKGWLQTIQK